MNIENNILMKKWLKCKWDIFSSNICFKWTDEVIWYSWNEERLSENLRCIWRMIISKWSKFLYSRKRWLVVGFRIDWWNFICPILYSCVLENLLLLAHRRLKNQMKIWEWSLKYIHSWAFIPPFSRILRIFNFGVHYLIYIRTLIFCLAYDIVEKFLDSNFELIRCIHV